MRLPNGRELAYPFPRLVTGKRGDVSVVFKDNQSGKWTDCRNGEGAYGGIWTENAVQAASGDLLVAAMPRLEAAGYPIVLPVHDEIVAEVPEQRKGILGSRSGLGARSAGGRQIPGRRAILQDQGNNTEPGTP
jgi:DNA polymerase